MVQYDNPPPLKAKNRAHRCKGPFFLTKNALFLTGFFLSNQVGKEFIAQCEENLKSDVFKTHEAQVKEIASLLSAFFYNAAEGSGNDGVRFYSLWTSCASSFAAFPEELQAQVL
jgi:hypothetical protein